MWKTTFKFSALSNALPLFWHCPAIILGLHVAEGGTNERTVVQEDVLRTSSRQTDGIQSIREETEVKLKRVARTRRPGSAFTVSIYNNYTELELLL